jgi:hypothetical protein
MSDIADESMIYAEEEPDIQALTDAYNSALLDNDTYFDSCRQSYDDRRNIWPGKSTDLRKHGANAFPWEGASDQEVNVVGERIDSYVAMFTQALSRSHIKAFPTSVASMPRAGVVSGFLKWMLSSYIPDFKGQMELGGNYLLEKGLMISYVGWTREVRTFLQTVTLEEIAQGSPELADMILAGDADEDLVALLQQSFPKLTSKRGRAVLRDMRSKGEAAIPMPRMSVDCPIVQACAPDGEVILPPYVTDPQRSPYIFWRTFYTAQELEKKVTAEGWDADWVENAIATLRGKDSDKLDGQKSHNHRRPITDDGDLIMVLHGYQRLIDEDDGSEGIFCTVFHPDAKGYAFHELLSGYDNYPFIFTRLSHNEKRLYETTTFSDTLRGSQMQIKTEEDSRIDRASMATLPPLMHPAGRPPSDWGPGTRIPYRRLGEIAFGPTPAFDPGSIEISMNKRQQADRAVGLDFGNPASASRQQFYIGKFLDHVRDVLGLAWQLFQRMGPDEVFFQVTGNPNPQTMTKGDPDEVYSIVVAFDSMANDPETAEAQMKQVISLVQYDRNGIIDMNKLLEFAAMSISPVLADYVLQPAEEAQQKITKNVTDDLAKIFAGIEVPAQANGAQVAMQIVQAYAQQPDIGQRLQQDQAFAERLQKYHGQYQFMMQQAQNAEIGKIGTAPAEMAGVNTQAMNQQ